MVFWVVVLYSLEVGNQHFGGCAASTLRFKFVIKEMYPLHHCLSREVSDAYSQDCYK